MNKEQFVEALSQKSLSVSEEQLNQFEKYYQLLVEWNEKMNLTAITEKEAVYLKHFYDSLTLGFYVDFNSGESLCDVGSGAGFPSIPLKIMFPELKIAIVDSLKKRLVFLQAVIDELNLKDVSLHHARAEDFGQDKAHRGQYDYVTARAVARLSVLSELCLPLVKDQGKFLAMKASGAEDELEIGKKAITTLGGKVSGDIRFDLGEDAGERHIIVIDKVKHTPKKYPRKAGTPNKQPIE